MNITLPLNIEIPSSPIEFNLGLMFRESLEQDSGMLFVFDSVGEKSFHMKDTMIPLDIAFISEEGIIESIKQLEPLNTIPVLSDADVLYALEVNLGWFSEHNVNIGDKVLEPSVVTIENSDGKEFADITDIIGPSNMEPVVQNGVWKGTRQVMVEQKSFSEFMKT